MSPRMLDLLHIIWLLFESAGLDPRQVNQAWMICQSLTRSSAASYPRGFFINFSPNIPGFSLSTTAAHGLAPCQLPRGSLWLNMQLRFATGAESLQLQGVHVATLCPSALLLDDDKLVKKIAGDGYSLTVVGWYMLLAMVTLMRRGRGQSGAASARIPPSGAALPSELDLGQAFLSAAEPLHPRALARHLVGALQNVWPAAFQNYHSPACISLASLCSGADFVKPFAEHLAHEVNALLRGEVLTIWDKVACEKNPKVWNFRRQHVAGKDPDFFFPDVHTLPWSELPSADVCTISTMCTSLSHQNNDRRSLLDTDPSDPKCASGATMHSALKYVALAQPKAVIFENVFGMLDKIPGRCDGKRNVDVVLETLRDHGYACGLDRQSAHQWMLPQTRRRLYVWGLCQDLAGAQAFGESVRCFQFGPESRLSLAECLLTR